MKPALQGSQCLNAEGLRAINLPVKAQIAPILGLSVSERREIVNVIWESIAIEHVELRVPDWQIDEVERRSAEMDANPALSISWEDVKQRVLRRDDRTR